MGMFEPVNYGESFVRGMAGMANTMIGIQEAQDRSKQLALDNQRADRKLQLEEQRGQSENAWRDEQTADLQRKADNEKLLQATLDLNARMKIPGYKPTMDDLKTISGINAATPYLPDTPQDIPVYRNALRTVMGAAQEVRNMPPGSFMAYRGDSPGTDRALNAFDVLLSKGRLGRDFTDADGHVTGTPGTQYRTTGVGGFGIQSGNGDQAAYIPLFAIADQNGQAILNPQTGKPVLVPATVDGSNDPNAELARLTPSSILAKGGFALQTMGDFERLAAADPETMQQILAARIPAAMGTAGASKVLEDANKASGEKRKAAGQQAVNQAVATAINSVPAGSDEETYMRAILQTGAVDAKTAGEIAKTVRTQKTWTTVATGDGVYAFDATTGKRGARLGSPTKTAASGDDKLFAQTRRDISVRLRDAQRGYNAALKTNDPDKIATAVDLISSLNEDAKVYGVPVLPVPKRPMTSDEEAQLREQAISNLKANRGAVGKLFNTSPAPEDINAEIQRLKGSGGTAGQSQQQPLDGEQPQLYKLREGRATRDTSDETHLHHLRGGTVAGGGSYVPGKGGMLPDGMQASHGAWRNTPMQTPAAASARDAKPRPSAAAFFDTKPGPSADTSAPPPAAQHSGRTIRDTVTGRRYKSNGSAWVEVR